MVSRFTVHRLKGSLEITLLAMGVKNRNFDFYEAINIL